ncbi:MAG: hypothetical protein WCR06_08760, partial [bacterium]
MRRIAPRPTCHEQEEKREALTANAHLTSALILSKRCAHRKSGKTFFSRKGAKPEHPRIAVADGCCLVPGIFHSSSFSDGQQPVIQSPLNRRQRREQRLTPFALLP